MKFFLEKPKENIFNLARKIGYRPLSQKEDELSCIRPLRGTNYPRFHLHIRLKESNLLFALHLDHKKTSYSGIKAHSGEYEGKLVKEEAERIKSVLKGF